MTRVIDEMSANVPPESGCKGGPDRSIRLQERSENAGESEDDDDDDDDADDVEDVAHAIFSGVWKCRAIGTGFFGTSAGRSGEAEETEDGDHDDDQTDDDQNVACHVTKAPVVNRSPNGRTIVVQERSGGRVRSPLGNICRVEPVAWSAIGVRPLAAGRERDAGHLVARGCGAARPPTRDKPGGFVKALVTY